MHEFVLDEKTGDAGEILHREEWSEGGSNAHLFCKPAGRGIADGLIGPRMGAAGVRPQSRRVIFPGSALLEQQAATAIAQDDGDGPMTTPPPVRLEFGHGADRSVIPADEDDPVERRIDRAQAGLAALARSREPGPAAASSACAAALRSRIEPARNHSRPPSSKLMSRPRGRLNREGLSLLHGRDHGRRLELDLGR